MTTLRNATINAANETMPETKGTLTRREWIMPEFLKMIQERRKFKNLNTVEHQKTYRILRNLIIRKSKEAKKKYLKKKCKEIDILMKTCMRKTAYKPVKMFFEARTPKYEAIAKKKEKIIYEQEQIVDK